MSLLQSAPVRKAWLHPRGVQSVPSIPKGSYRAHSLHPSLPSIPVLLVPLSYLSFFNVCIVVLFPNQNSQDFHPVLTKLNQIIPATPAVKQ